MAILVIGTGRAPLVLLLFLNVRSLLHTSPTGMLFPFQWASRPCRPSLYIGQAATVYTCHDEALPNEPMESSARYGIPLLCIPHTTVRHIVRHIVKCQGVAVSHVRLNCVLDT